MTAEPVLALPLLLVAAFLAGALNAVAGSVRKLPALVLVGAPPVAANTTGKLALPPSYLG